MQERSIDGLKAIIHFSCRGHWVLACTKKLKLAADTPELAPYRYCSHPPFLCLLPILTPFLKSLHTNLSWRLAKPCQLTTLHKSCRMDLHFWYPSQSDLRSRAMCSSLQFTPIPALVSGSSTSSPVRFLPEVLAHTEQEHWREPRGREDNPCRWEVSVCTNMTGARE